MVATEQRDLMHRIESFVASHHPYTAVRESLGVDSTVSVQVLGREEDERDRTVRDLAGVLHLGEAGVSADGRIYCASFHGVAVWTLHSEGVS